MRVPRRALGIATAALILLEIASIVILVPLTTFSISLGEVYAQTSLAFTLGVCVFAALVGGIAALVALQNVRPNIVSVATAALACAGTVMTTFLLAGVAISFGYLALDDTYPDGFAVNPNWASAANLAGPPLLIAAVVWVAVRAILKPVEQSASTPR